MWRSPCIGCWVGDPAQRGKVIYPVSAIVSTRCWWCAYCGLSEFRSGSGAGRCRWLVVGGAWRVVDESVEEVPKGAVPLSAAIGALRDELMQAVWAGQFPYELNGQQRRLRFKSAVVELTLQVAVTTKGTAKAGVKWWLIEAGGELAREKVATQTVKLSLEPVLFDVEGNQVELLIDAADDGEHPLTGDERDEELL
jgi:Trypsin-co-occurring domain 2